MIYKLEPRHLEDYPIQHFLKTKEKQKFFLQTNKIKGSTMQSFKTLKPFELTWPLKKQPSDSWILLVRLQNALESFVFKNRDWIMFFQVPRFE